MKEIIVPSKWEGKKLNTFLLDTFENLSLSAISMALRKKDIRINGIKIKENQIIHEKDCVQIFLADSYFEKSSALPPIVYEDENILVFNKPSKLEVTGEDSLENLVQVKYAYAKPCHRLDRNTKGLVLFAKNEESLLLLLSKFENQEIEKHYLAKVYGIPKEDKKSLEAYLFKDSKKALVYISAISKKGYVPIRTSYKVLEKNPKENYSILEVELHTGKTHQIRAHLAYIGYPIIGDGKYGNNEINKKFHVKEQELTSYQLTFAFKSDASFLNYLKGKTIQL